MKLKFCLVITCFIFLQSFSQNFGITKGDIVKDRQFLIDKNEVTACDILGNFVSVRPHKINGTLRNYFIEFFNNLDYQERQEIETQNSTEILDVFIKNKTVHVLIKEQNKDNISLRFDLFNLKNKVLSKKELINVNQSNKALFKAIKNNEAVLLNNTSSFLMSVPIIENKTVYVHLEYFDNYYKPISSQKIYPNKNLNRKHISFLDTKWYNNKIYLLFSITDGDKFYKLIEVDNENTRALEIPIKPDSYELINSKLIKDHLVINGLFSHRKKGAFEGFTYYDINLNTFSIQSKKLSNFKNEASKKYFIGLFKSNRSIDIKDIFIDDEKNTILVAQFYTLKKQYVPVGLPIATFAVGSFVGYITYNPISASYKVFDDILISKVNKNGELIWDNILELKQTEKMASKYNKKDSSYFAFLRENQLNILLNGYINMEKDRLIVKQDKQNSKTSFYNIKIDSNGVINPVVVFPNNTSNILFKADNSKETNSGIYNFGQGNMRKQLLKLTF